MGVNYNTLPTNRGLLLSCDFANSKNYNIANENLFLYSQQFDAANWTALRTNPTVVNDLNPFGQSGGVYLVSNGIGQLSYLGQAVTLSNSSTYNVSLYVKPLSGTKIVAFEVNVGGGYQVPVFDLNSLTSSGGNGTNTIQTLSNGWYRISATVTTAATGNAQFNVIYFGAYGSSTIQSTFLVYGAQIQRSTTLTDYVQTTSSAVVSNTIVDQISGLTGTLTNNGYLYFDTSTRSLKFDRSSTVVSGGYVQFTGTGSLTATNFLYNDHTMEIFAKINDYNPSNINANEGDSSLFNYMGYHAGFHYNSTNLLYSLWSGTGYPTWTFSTTPTVGQWFHAVATRSGTTTSIYLNGVLIASSSYPTGTNPGVTDLIKLGAGNPSTGPYANYAKCNVSIARMYNVALSASEVLQNFNAFRGRGGI